MVIGIVSGIISGIICSIFVTLFNWSVNVKARSDVERIMKRLIQYLSSINNDVTWGIEDEHSDYYDNMIGKLFWAYSLIDNAYDAIKKFNFCFNHRKYIIKQLQEIEHGLDTFLIEVAAVSPNEEKIARLRSLACSYQTLNDNILIRRAEFVLNLLQYHSLNTALDKSCADSTDESISDIRTILSKL